MTRREIAFSSSGSVVCLSGEFYEEKEERDGEDTQSYVRASEIIKEIPGDPHLSLAIVASNSCR